MPQIAFYKKTYNVYAVSLNAHNEEMASELISVQAEAEEIISLLIVNIAAFKTGTAEGFYSKYRVINILEQIGRYGCMVFMILPVFVKNWAGYYSC